MTTLVIWFLLVWPLNFARLAIIHFEANEAEIFEDVIRKTQETISHTGIFDTIKNALFLAPLLYIECADFSQQKIVHAFGMNSIF